MSEAKHTDGEWSVLEHEGEVFVLADGAMQVAAVTYVIEHAREVGSRRLQNARLMAAAPELLEEHQQWAEWLGEAMVLALQGDYSKVDELARTFRIGFPSGSAVVKSDAIAKALGSQP